MIEFTITTTKTVQNLLKPVPIRIEVTNISKQVIEIYKALVGINYIENGEDVMGMSISWDDATYIKLKPFESFETEIDSSFITQEHLIGFYNTYKDKKCIEKFTLSINAQFVIKSVHPQDMAYIKSKNKLVLEVDYTKTEQLLTSKKQPSLYIKYNNDIVYISDNSRAYEKPSKKLAINKTAFKILNENYIIDDKKVFRDGNLQRLSAKEFKIFNELFAGNPEKILTTYGNAKVKDPESFKSFTANTSRVGYSYGYAIDKYHLYFYDEGSGSTHAKIAKACKKPSTFKELSYGEYLYDYDEEYGHYGMCERTVYIKGVSISMADAKTWEYLGSYSKDKKSVFYHTYKVQGADVSSFEVIKDLEVNKYKTLEHSRWAKDKNHYYNCGKKTTKESYENNL